MSHPLYIAFIWHQHQPLYRSRDNIPPLGNDDFSHLGRYRLPWVRLHGCKDYLDLILVLSKYPKLHQTVNLVPSLILQIEDYVNGTAEDPYSVLTLTPVEHLTQLQKTYIIEHFFDANARHLIDPHPRYAELYHQRQSHGRTWCLKNWQAHDYSDLLAWHNLAWFDPLFWDDNQINHWLEKGRGFTWGDRQQILEKQRQILAQIVPHHGKMQVSGQLEVTTTPYTHPILPLLADTNAGRIAVPHMTLPNQRFQWPEDITRQLRKAREVYHHRFGSYPRGLWPSEQSVSPQVLPYIAQCGFQWLCSDESVLGWTLQQFFHRDGSGTVLEPEILYRPYRLSTPSGDLAIVFRDHRLSDLIGFTYGGMDPKLAAVDLVGHLEAIARTLKSRQPDSSTSLEQPWLVTIALDGENCWEFYHQDGKPFLENLYQIFSDHPQFQLVTVEEYIRQFPPTVTLPSESLHSGSWVDGSFTTWIGDPIKNKAWELLTTARHVLANHPEATEITNPDAWEALDAAEGSDWFWWFGAGHSSNQDAIFDQLFREHLIALYQSLGESIPEALFHPLEVHAARGEHRPEGFIHPEINGYGDEQDWDKAGRIDVGGSRGTMHRSSAVQRLWYGYDHLNLYFRLDFHNGTQPGLNAPSELNLFWYYPDRPMNNSGIPLGNLPDIAPLNYLFHHHLGVNLQTGTLWYQEAGEHHQWHGRIHRVQAAIGDCMELSIPWADMGVAPDWSLRIVAVLAEHGQYQGCIPENALISIEVP